MIQERAPRTQKDTRSRASKQRDFIRWAVLAGPLIIMVAGLWYESLQQRPCQDVPSFLAVAHWFDPVFFQYNLLLGLLAILIVPTVPLLYVHAMAWRKKARLEREIPAADLWKVDHRLQVRSRYKFYLGSTALTTMIVALGISILLLFKPVRAAAQCGVDFSHGANMLMMGPYIADFGGTDPAAFDVYYRHLIAALAGFQFGFLGAYIYFLTSLSRAYFQLDLTPETMVDGAVRIAVASVISLVLSFGSDRLGLPGTGPIISFFFGFFPRRALAFLEQSALALARNLSPSDYKATPLSVLHGMSYSHELRLEREGFDGAENLSHADAVDLAVRTGFCYSQLRQWIGEAWLASHLREDYALLVKYTGILSREELEHVIASGGVERLLSTLPSDPEMARVLGKLAIIRTLL
jgi:hypothetical protein